jgi:hypothetical protein
MTNNKRVLSDHIQKKKRLVPPLLAVMGEGSKPYSWAQELMPDLIWITFLQEYLGLRRGVECAMKFISTANDVYLAEPKPFFCKAGSYSKFSDQEKGDLLKGLEESGYLIDIQKSLSPIFHFFPECPLNFLKPENSIYMNREDALSFLNGILPDMYDRHSKKSARTQATAMYSGLRQGKIIIAMDKVPLFSELNEIEDYPDTEKSQMVAASLRAAMPMFLIGADEEDTSSEWIERFWIHLSGFGNCELEIQMRYYEEDAERDELEKIIARFCNAARKELQERIDKWKFDLNSIEFYEVIGALLARQATLAVDLAVSPMIWTPHSAALFHRAMADVYITISWIFKDPEKRSKKFVEDGIGNIKLEIEHRKQELEKRGNNDPKIQRMIEFQEKWVSSQRIADLVEVNLGSWSGITTRQMAIEADCLDFYNYVYQPFSAAIHSTWPHISVKNMQYCSNPAHRYHRMPIIIDFQPDPHFLYLAAKYLQKAFAKFDTETGIKIEAISAYDQLYEDLYGEDSSERDDREIKSA